MGKTGMTMNLHRLLSRRATEKRPLRIALIGAGKFGSMFLAQAGRTPGIHLVAVVDLMPRRARSPGARRLERGTVRRGSNHGRHQTRDHLHLGRPARRHR
jgi:predicted homoserine dehydrogenase-like protein